MNNPPAASLPLHRGAAFVLALLFLGAGGASAQQTVTLQPSVPKIVTGASFNQASTNVYTVPVIVTFAGGNDVVNFAASGAPAGSVATVSPTTLTNSGLVNLNVTITGVALGDYPITVTASGAASGSTSVSLVAGHLWKAASLPTANWATGTNWTPGAIPGAGNHVKFEDAGVITNVVDASVDIDSLTYARFTSGATNNTVIAPNVTLSVLGSGGFVANVESTNGNNKVTTINISGGGSLVVSNPAAVFAVNGLNAGNDGTRFNMQGLSNFTAVVDKFGLGDVALAQAGGWGQQLIRVTLARTNLVRAGYVGSYNELENTNAISIFNNSDRFNNGAANNVDLGIVNVFEADSLSISKVAAGSANNIVRFNSTFLTGTPRPSVTIRGIGGSRMSLLNIGVPSGTQNVAANSQGTLDLRGGTADLFIQTLVLGANRSRYTNAAGNTFGRGTIAFNDGRLDVNVARLGWQRFTNDAYARGTIAVGGTGVLSINDHAELGFTTAGDPVSGDAFIAQGFGQLIATNGGVIRVNRVTVGDASTNNNISISAGGNVILSNSVATLEHPLSVLDMADGSLTLHVNGPATNVFVQALVSGGLQNLINLASVSGLTLPAQVPLISYWFTPSAPNFSMGTLPAGIYGVLVNNAVNSTIDAILSTTPPKTIVWRGDKSSNWDHTTLNWVLAGTSIETNFADGDFVIFNDTLVGSGSVTIVETIVAGQSPTLPGITVSNFTYTFSGSSRLLGTARVLKTGTGDITFNGISENSVQVSQGTLFGSGTVGAVSVASGAALSFTGTINGGLTCAGAATNSGNINGPLTLQTGGVLENPGNTTGALTLNNGTLLANGGRMNAVGSPVVPTNSTIINNGTIEGVRVDINAGGTVKGTGTFEVSNRVQANAGGTLMPGGSIGSMTIGGTIGRLDLFPGSTTIIEVDLAQPDGYDVIFNGSLNFGGNNAFAGGTILVTNVGATPFTGTETLRIFRPIFSTDILHNNISFPVASPQPGAGLVWDVTGIRTNGVLRIVGPPTFTRVIVNNTNQVFAWPSNYVGWRLEVQTNSAGIQPNAPGVTNWFTVPGSVNSSNIVIQTINRTNRPTFYRLAYP